jgi:hypothetical protein
MASATASEPGTRMVDRGSAQNKSLGTEKGLLAHSFDRQAVATLNKPPVSRPKAVRSQRSKA